MRVHIASIGQLAARSTVDAVDLGMCKVLQLWQAQLLCQCVDARMAEKFFSSLIGRSLWLLGGGGGP